MTINVHLRDGCCVGNVSRELALRGLRNGFDGVTAVVIDDEIFEPKRALNYLERHEARGARYPRATPPCAPPGRARTIDLGAPFDPAFPNEAMKRRDREGAPWVPLTKGLTMKQAKDVLKNANLARAVRLALARSNNTCWTPERWA